MNSEPEEPKAGTLWASLKNSRGNQRACILTEPLWGIPFNLYTPYMSVYMLALGVGDRGIGLVASIGLMFQVFTALLGGPITDKLGRKRTTFIFDLLSWSIPALLWAASQNIYWFIAAAIGNSLFRITMTSWSCLLVEDAPKHQLVNIWSWVYISGVVAGFVAPISGFMVAKFSLVPTVRGLFVFTFVMMTAKFIILNVFAEETPQGKKRMVETRSTSILTLLRQYTGVVQELLRSRATVAAVAVLLAVMIYKTVRNAFWSVLLTEGLQFAPETLAWFHALRSAVMLFFYFVILPRIDHERIKESLVIGFGLSAVGVAVLLITPPKALVFVLVSTVIEAAGFALAGPFMEALLVRAIDPEERARILALANVFVIALTTPFGWLAGVLSEMNKSLPFVLLLGVLAVAVAAILYYRRPQRPRKPQNSQGSPR
jgi:MFS family permease